MTTLITKKLWKPCRSAPILLIFIGAICLLAPVQAEADGKPKEVKIPQSAFAGLHHFLDLAGPEKSVTFDPGLVDGVMAFVEAPKDDGNLHFADGIRGLPSAYYEFDSHADLRKITDYAFNPDIPCIATMPSSVRLFDWMDEKGQRRQTPRVKRYLIDLDASVVGKALQYVEITPDTNSGAYYGYNLYQTLIVFKYRQRSVIATITRQTDVSSVGKKGYVLGSDDDWDYFYSGKKGLTIPALGWVSSYMYESSAVNIYYEIDPGSPRVRCAMFKWLKAGWAGINMVKRSHIYNGLKRFAKPFKQILEHPALPPVEALASDFSKIRNFSEDTLRKKMAVYSDILKRRYNGPNPNGNKRSADLLADSSHLPEMSRDEMESALIIEYMKAVIGKSSAAETAELFDFKTINQ